MPRSKQQSERMRQEAREAILEAALALFGEKGFGGATTAEIAVQAGVSKGLVFNYFPTKDALLEALIERTLERSLKCWEEADWSGPPADQLARIVDVGLAEVRAQPKFYRLYFSLVLQPGGSDAVHRAVSRLMPRLAGYYGRTESLMAALGSESPKLDAQIFQCALNGLVHMLAAEAGLLERADPVKLDALKARLLARFVPSAPSKDLP